MPSRWKEIIGCIAERSQTTPSHSGSPSRSGRSPTDSSAFVEVLEAQFEGSMSDLASYVGPLSKTRVLLADDYRPLLESVLRLLRPEFEIVGEAQNGQALIEAAFRLKPDVIVTDIGMPILNGIEAAKRLREAGSTSKIVFLTVLSDPDLSPPVWPLGRWGMS